MPKRKSTVPDELKPFVFHGVAIDYSGTSQECVADECPFCLKEGKFSVNRSNSKYHCKVCGISGNSTTFIREFYNVMPDTADNRKIELKKDRNLMSTASLDRWGIKWNSFRGEWVIPAFNTKKEICQLYSYRTIDGKKRFLATPGFSHGLFMDKASWGKLSGSQFILCEGPWDAIALWEVIKKHPDQSMRSSTIMATPGCNVFNKAWNPLFSNQKVVIIFDNDHPKVNEKTGLTNQAGWKGLELVVSKMSNAKNPPKSISICQWGPDGFNPTLPDGCDVRDYLTGI